MSVKSSSTCFCCSENFNKSTRLRVRCPLYLKDKQSECGWESCRSCIRKYLIGHVSGPHCMSCKQPWERTHLIHNLSRSWVEKTYSTHTKHILFETEKARLAEDQVTASNYKKIGPLKEKMKLLRGEREALYEKFRALDHKARITSGKINQYSNMDDSKQKKEKKKFIRKCPDKECHGFLSTRWKCEICSKTVCSKCLEFKIIADPNENCAIAEHVCDENNVKTAELLKKDTKPCPSCGEQITKISGCDQMWCPECKNAWSWNNGTVIHGVIHNPHYYEYLRSTNNGIVPRTLGDVQCGGFPQYYNWRVRVMHKYRICDTKLYNDLMRVHRGIAHFQYTIIQPTTRKIEQFRNNKRLRVLYICKEITEEVMKKTLLDNHKQIQKDMSRLQIYQLYNTLATENIVDIYNHSDNKGHIQQCLINIKQARIYVNRELAKISFLWKRSVKIITENFNIRGFTITSKKSLEVYLKENTLKENTLTNEILSN